MEKASMAAAPVGRSYKNSFAPSLPLLHLLPFDYLSPTHPLDTLLRVLSTTRFGVDSALYYPGAFRSFFASFDFLIGCIGQVDS